MVVGEGGEGRGEREKQSLKSVFHTTTTAKNDGTDQHQSSSSSESSFKGMLISLRIS